MAIDKARGSTSGALTPVLEYHLGMGSPGNPMNMHRISDGTSNTIMLAEMRQGLSDSDPRGVSAHRVMRFQLPLSPRLFINFHIKSPNGSRRDWTM